jgi:hypothetical protein
MNTEEQEITQNTEVSPVTQEDGVIKINLGELNKQNRDAIQEQSADEVPVLTESASREGVREAHDEETIVEVAREEIPVENKENVLEEITDEQVQEAVAVVEEKIADALEAQSNGVQLPENIQKVVDFMEETGGTLEDYVKLNTDYASLNEDQLLREYYQSTRPDLDADEIDFLLDDKFTVDEDYDDEKDQKRKKLARKEELLKAKNHLDGLKSKYYAEVKAGSKLNPEQQKAIEFFNRYNKQNEEESKIGARQKSVFETKTKEVFSSEFKGFEYNVGEKKYRFNVKNAEEVKTTQSDITNFVKKFLNENNELADAKGYHKSLFTAMNPDAIANHFYEQGKADAMKDSITKAKNIDMSSRGAHEQVTNNNGWSVRSVNGIEASEFKIKIKNNKI